MYCTNILSMLLGCMAALACTHTRFGKVLLQHISLNICRYGLEYKVKCLVGRALAKEVVTTF